MTLREFALDYQQCSIPELISFIKSRTGEVWEPPSTTMDPDNPPELATDANDPNPSHPIPFEFALRHDIKHDTSSDETDHMQAVRALQSLRLAKHLRGSKGDFLYRMTDATPSLFTLFDALEAKIPYIARLRRADAEAKFRFFDLPPELRNHVYEDLLIPRFRSRGEGGGAYKRCWPAILGTCREALREGHGICYAEENVSVDVRDVAERSATRRGEWFVRMMVGFNHAERMWPLQGAGMVDCPVVWPRFLLGEGRCLRVNVDLQLQPDELEMGEVGVVLWHLHYFLLSARGKGVERVLVTVDCKERVDWEGLRDMLEPVRLMAPVVELRLQGVYQVPHALLQLAVRGLPRAEDARERVERYGRLQRRSFAGNGWEGKDEVMKVNLDQILASRRVTVAVDAWLQRLLRALETGTLCGNYVRGVEVSPDLDREGGLEWKVARPIEFWSG